MDLFTVAFFGHREMSDTFAIEACLEETIRVLILNKEYIEFLVGRDGEFDQLVSSVIRRCKEKYASGNVSHILVLPYERAEYRENRDSFEAYYDEVEIYPGEGTYFKDAIVQRNRYMAERSNKIICCIEHESGGAYAAVKYAEKIGKKIINLCNEFEQNR